jgi:hypothetical protein
MDTLREERSMLAAPDGRWSWVAGPRRCRSLVRERVESFQAAGLPMTRDRTSTCLVLRTIAEHRLLGTTLVPADATAVHVLQIRTRQEESEEA